MLLAFNYQLGRAFSERLWGVYLFSFPLSPVSLFPPALSLQVSLSHTLTSTRTYACIPHVVYLMAESYNEESKQAKQEERKQNNFNFSPPRTPSSSLPPPPLAPFSTHSLACSHALTRTHSLARTHSHAHTRTHKPLLTCFFSLWHLFLFIKAHSSFFIFQFVAKISFVFHFIFFQTFGTSTLSNKDLRFFWIRSQSWYQLQGPPHCFNTW